MPTVTRTRELDVRQLHYDREANTLSADISDVRDGIESNQAGTYLTIRGTTRRAYFVWARYEYTGAGEDREVAAHIFHPLTYGDPLVRLWND